MHAAGTPLTGRRGALALLAGAGIALGAPSVPHVVWLLLAAGVGTWAALRPSPARLAGVMLVGFALAGMHARHALSVRLPPEPARTEAIVTGRVTHGTENDAGAALLRRAAPAVVPWCYPAISRAGVT